ncbi:MAG: DUF3142 domain-containing protein [Acidobacteriia bacterium]|nr:DUF3142 domain-containing protein [Terriglobia bacterium]
MRRKIILLAAVFALFCAAGALLAGKKFPDDDRAGGLPNVILWAWERPEDFRYLTPGEAGVAFLAETIYLREPREKNGQEAEHDVRVQPRRQPLRVSPGTALIAVARIETLRAQGAGAVQQVGSNSAESSLPYTEAQRRRVAEEISQLQNIEGVRAVQIDFDATQSERAFYAELLRDVRARLRQEQPLSITALASWCLGDAWLAQLPAGTIDEAVPMLFRMGGETGEVARILGRGEEFTVAACRGSAGLSTDEVPGQAEKRVYLFHPRPWTKTEAKKWIEEAGQWHER